MLVPVLSYPIQEVVPVVERIETAQAARLRINELMGIIGTEGRLAEEAESAVEAAVQAARDAQAAKVSEALEHHDRSAAAQDELIPLLEEWFDELRDPLKPMYVCVENGEAEYHRASEDRLEVDDLKTVVKAARKHGIVGKVLTRTVTYKLIKKALQDHPEYLKLLPGVRLERTLNWIVRPGKSAGDTSTKVTLPAKPRPKD